MKSMFLQRMYVHSAGQWSWWISYCHFSYAETWELLNLFVGTKNFCYHICYENLSSFEGILQNQERRNTEQRNTEHRQNSGTPRNNKIRNAAGTAERPETVAEQWNTPEYQRNTSGTFRNNGTIANEEQL